MAAVDDGENAPQSPLGFRLHAYAKLNLSLEILGRRGDGFHDIASVTQTISLADIIVAGVAVPDGDDSDAPLSIQMAPPLVSADQNLARRAAEALASATGRAAAGHLRIRKQIPLAAGLGGGSSDAAATLRLCDRLWQTGLGTERLAEIGATLGSDVPLFLGASTSLIGGRGETVAAVTSPRTFWVVLGYADCAPPDKTRALYAALAPNEWTDGSATRALAEHLRRGGTLSDAFLVNGFDRAADRVYPGFAELRARLAGDLGRPVHLTGAGPTLYATFDDAAAARGAARKVTIPGLQVFVARSISRRPAIVGQRPAIVR